MPLRQNLSPEEIATMKERLAAVIAARVEEQNRNLAALGTAGPPITSELQEERMPGLAPGHADQPVIGAPPRGVGGRLNPDVLAMHEGQSQSVPISESIFGVPSGPTTSIGSQLFPKQDQPSTKWVSEETAAKEIVQDKIQDFMDARGIPLPEMDASGRVISSEMPVTSAPRPDESARLAKLMEQAKETGARTRPQPRGVGWEGQAQPVPSQLPQAGPQQPLYEDPSISAALKAQGPRRTGEKQISNLDRDLLRLDRERQGLMTPRELPTGAAGWGEAILSQLSRGDSRAIHAERERKREKALGILTGRKGELEQERGRIRGELKETREEEAARIAAGQLSELTEAQIKGVVAQTANVSRPTPESVVERDGKWVRDWRLPNGEVAYTTEEMDPGVAALSPKGIEFQKELLDHNAEIVARQFRQQIAAAQTPLQQTALASMNASGQAMFAAAQAAAEAVWNDYQATPAQKEKALVVFKTEISRITNILWTGMWAIGSNSSGPWMNVFQQGGGDMLQQGGGAGQLPPGVSPGEPQIIGPAGDIQVIRNGRWVPLQ